MEQRPPTSPWFDTWYQELIAIGPRMSDKQLLACARLATVLICGEQSAIQIFSEEVRRSRHGGELKAIRDLVRIEQDEHLHEQMLIRFRQYLPTADDQHSLQRRAQRFFARIGRDGRKDMARHFGQISQLDSAVCKIMWCIENSSLDAAAPLRVLARRIKMDEARHVAVSRRYASEMGYTKRALAEDNARVCEDLVTLLTPLGASFEDVGVDTDDLFARIRSH